MKKLLMLCLVISTLSLVACNESKKEDSTEVAKETNDQKAENSNTEKMNDDADFAVEVANGGMLEVKLGELAQANGSSAAVKQFGAMMVKDHGAANEKLMAVAAAQSITLPAMINADAQKMYDDMATKKGKDFDKMYIDMMADDHDKDIKKFEEEANDGKNSALKEFATATLPTLKMHKQKIESIQSSMK